MTFFKRRSLAAMAAVWGLLAGAAPLLAHHSTTMFDLQKNVTLTGLVKRVDLKNPHSLFYITVTDEKGTEVEWVLEAQPRGTLLQIGWTTTTLKPGDKVTFIGSPARNGSPFMWVRAIQLPDGRSLGT